MATVLEQIDQLSTGRLSQSNVVKKIVGTTKACNLNSKSGCKCLLDFKGQLLGEKIPACGLTDLGQALGEMEDYYNYLESLDMITYNPFHWSEPTKFWKLFNPYFGKVGSYSLKVNHPKLGGSLPVFCNAALKELFGTHDNGCFKKFFDSCLNKNTNATKQPHNPMMQAVATDYPEQKVKERLVRILANHHVSRSKDPKATFPYNLSLPMKEAFVKYEKMYPDIPIYSKAKFEKLYSGARSALFSSSDEKECIVIANHQMKYKHDMSKGDAKRQRFDDAKFRTVFAWEGKHCATKEEILVNGRAGKDLLHYADAEVGRMPPETLEAMLGYYRSRFPGHSEHGDFLGGVMCEKARGMNPSVFCNSFTVSATGNSLLDMLRSDGKTQWIAPITEGYSVLKDHAIALATQHLQSLGETEIPEFQVSTDTAFLQSRPFSIPRTCQNNHIDMHAWYIRDNLLSKQIYVFSVFMPLQEEGMYLRLIENRSTEDGDDNMVFIMHGSYLMMPASCWHAGNFVTSLDGNIRNQIYVVLTPKGVKRPNLSDTAVGNDTVYQTDGKKKTKEQKEKEEKEKGNGVVLVEEDGRRIHVWDGEEVNGLKRGEITLSHSSTDSRGAVMHGEGPNISKLLCNMNDVLLL